MNQHFEELFVERDDLLNFAVWAFGDNFEDLEKSSQFLNAWNRLHGKELLLDMHGVISEDAIKMVDLYRSR